MHLKSQKVAGYEETSPKEGLILTEKLLCKYKNRILPESRDFGDSNGVKKLRI